MFAKQHKVQKFPCRKNLRHSLEMTKMFLLVFGEDILDEAQLTAR
jgi:LPS O-antigen subunit length determinant protein (WzzB/FepE family)